MKRLLFLGSLSSLILACGSAAVATAHVLVSPDQAGVATSQLFTVSVPNERQSSVTGLRLVLPPGLQAVSPSVKAGWLVTTKPTGSGQNASISEIDWTNGSIPAGQRDDFTFSAKVVPSTAMTLQWKAYQTYADGTVVNWDQAPGTTTDESNNKGPYSV